MIRSMTGYGEAEQDTPVGRLRAEIRTVNHRYFSANLRLARAVERYEPQVREWLRAFMPRGHVNCAIRVEQQGADTGEGPQLMFDEARARQYMHALMEMKKKLGLSGDVDVALLARYNDLIVPVDDTAAPELDPELIRALIENAARMTVVMREQEGLRLAADLEARLVSMEKSLARITELAPARLISERDRMRRVVSELLEGISVDEERIAREIAHMAERWDVSEELVRMRSHIELFRESVNATSADPIGKRLSFLVQEMNRETNTIGSKANDSGIEHEVIAIKDEIERLREQIENVE